MAGMEAYYQDEYVTLYHGDCMEIMDDMPVAKAVITDPPYSQATHGNAKSNKGKGHGTKQINFTALEDPNRLFGQLADHTEGWIIANVDYKHAFQLDATPPPGLRMLRVGVWVKTNPMPQISADRPAPGWEAIIYMHREDVKPKWNGGGQHGNYVLPLSQGTGHPTSKPISMISDWVRKFTNHGDTILDPFAGSGSTLKAARDEGRNAIGIEVEEKYCEIIAKRLDQQTLDFGALA